ncbi:25199_t:CDS:2 [Gigaspora rosea]|nr:25199_t:CDS:2 [Gigaspora rosea]
MKNALNSPLLRKTEELEKQASQQINKYSAKTPYIPLVADILVLRWLCLERAKDIAAGVTLKYTLETAFP